jgi:hypothetical protein
MTVQRGICSLSLESTINVHQGQGDTKIER